MTRGAILFSLALAAAAGASPPDSAQGRVVSETLHSSALGGNLIGETPDRKITVYLPPGYESDAGRRFPVVYLLHGMTSDPVEWLDGSYQGMDLRLTMDHLIGAGLPAFILVMPHADNRFGGTFYVDSAAFGGWERFVVKELVPWADKRFRTFPKAVSRGLAGQSMGGFGALNLAGRHPDIFGHVYAMSACCLGFVGELAPDSDVWKSGNVSAEAVPEGAPSAVRWVRIMAAALAPVGRSGSSNVTTPAPFAPDAQGQMREVERVAENWRAVLPLERLARRPDGYRRLRSIALEFGREDPIASVRDGSRAFAQALQKAGIPHAFVEFSGGHVDHVREGFEKRLLPFFGRAFSSKHG